MKPQNQIKERPILFSAPMIRAILSGNKTQTRRTKGLLNVNPKATEIIRCDGWPRQGDFVARFRYEGEPERYEVTDILKAPYGVGDVLWVRETAGMVESEKVYGTEGIATTIETWAYRATYPDAPVERWKPSIHMPKEAARIWLRVKSVEAQRIQDISEEDAISEGVESIGTGEIGKPEIIGLPRMYRDYTSVAHGFTHTKNSKRFVAKESFCTLWCSINGAGSWQENPWVWVVEFEVLNTTGKPEILKP